MSKPAFPHAASVGLPTIPTLQFCRPDLVTRSYQPRANISGKSNEWCRRIAVRVECRADLVSPQRCAGVKSGMTSRQGTGRGPEPASKITTPKVPIQPFMNVRLRVRDVCCGAGTVVASASAPRLLMALCRHPKTVSTSRCSRFTRVTPHTLDPFRTLPVSNAAETWRAKRGQTAHWVLAIPLGQARSRTAK